MTLQVVAGFLGQNGIQHSAKLYRNFSAAHAGRRAGFFRYNDFLLTPSGSGMSLNIGAGDAYLHGTEAVTDQGGYYVWNNATETLAWPASTSLPRVDSLILRTIDTDYGSDPAGSKATWEVVSGTPAASPSAVADSAFAPAGAYYHPGAWLRVADFTVPASATNLAAATLSHKRKYARLGRHTMNLTGDNPTDAQFGDYTNVIDGNVGAAFFYNGTAWVLQSQFITGTYTPTLTSTGTQPNLGSGGIAEGRYFTLAGGKWQHIRGTIRFGTSGTSAGTGQYLIALPFAASGNITNGVSTIGQGVVRSGGALSAITFYLAAGSSNMAGITAAGNNLAQATPGAWTANDYISFSMTYESA